MRGEYFTVSLMNTERLQGGGDFVNDSVWLSTTSDFSRNLFTNHSFGSAPKGLCSEVKSKPGF